MRCCLCSVLQKLDALLGELATAHYEATLTTATLTSRHSRAMPAATHAGALPNSELKRMWT